jgi:flagellin
MVVQHNISAMNANRYYGINNKALAGSLEKLSSGYAINRAGDNAAGLAVSEKMRAQIGGLTQAKMMRLSKLDLLGLRCEPQCK